MTRAFEFTAGSLALNFVDTVAQRSTEPQDLLATPDDLQSWLRAAGFPQDFDVSPRQLKAAIALREAAFGLLDAVVEERPLPNDAIATLNDWSARQDLRPQFKDNEVIMVSPRPLEAVLAGIAADALLLLADGKTERLRRCSECAMLFFDQSRPGKRRWCSSASGCGNRAKVRRHRERKRQEARQ